MSKQSFTTGQVLTAAQMTALQLNDYNQAVSAKVASYTLVASDAGTRITMSNASATTITVNTSLFAAGDTLFITNIGAGASTITAGTATVSTASSLVLAQYDSGSLYFTSTGVAIWEKYQGAAASTSGMTKITGATFSAVAGVAVNGCFTSTYKKYVVVVEGLMDSINASNSYLQLQYSTSTVQATAYYSCTATRPDSGGQVDYQVNNGTKWTLGLVANTARHNFTATITNVGTSSIQGCFSHYGNLATNGYSVGGGIVASNQIYTGFYLSGAGNISGSYTVYGLAD